MTEDTSSPAFLYAREQEAKRKSEAEAKQRALNELLACAEASLVYVENHVNLDGIKLARRLSAALDEYHRAFGVSGARRNLIVAPL